MDVKRLSAGEAAGRLGVTPELLFQFSRLRLKPGQTDQQRLQRRGVGRETYYLSTELDAFDEFLRAPWVEEGGDRPALPAAIRDYIRAESGGACLRCGDGSNLEFAHIEPWAKSRSHHPHNLVHLCVRCHREFDANKVVALEEISSLKSGAVERLRRLVGTRHRRLFDDLIPPAPSRGFCGREGEIESVVTALEAERSLIVRGVGGIGKTQLLLHALARAQCERPVVWLEATKFGDLSGLKAALALSLAGPGEAPPTIAALPAALDRAQACLVLDGVERGAVGDTDALDDFLTWLIDATHRTQIVVTSQVRFVRARFDFALPLGTLSPEASLAILTQAQLDRPAPTSDPAYVELASSCDGHPFALRIAVALAEYFGGPANAAARIKAQGARAMALPARQQHDESTSLDVCLSLAHDALSPLARRLLWTFAHAPAGILEQFVDVFVEPDLEVPVALASLKQWHFLEGHEDSGNWRLQALAPIRTFILGISDKANNIDGEALYKQTWTFVAQAVAFQDHYLAGNDPGMGVARFKMELGNLLYAIDLAVAHGHQERFQDLLRAHAAAMMQFFFISGLFERGAALMARCAELTRQSGVFPSASDFYLLQINLLQRAGAKQELADAYAALESLETASDHPRLQGNIAIARSMRAEGQQQAAEAIAWAQRASALFGAMEDQDEATHRWLTAQMSLAHGLEEGGRPQEAIDLYRDLLTRAVERKDAVNIGQIQHHIGNCSLDLGKSGDGVEAYLAAYKMFVELQMVEFISNSACCLGHAIVKAALDIDVDERLTADELAAALVDTRAQIERSCSPAIPLEHELMPLLLQKVAGVIWLLSQSRYASLLGRWSQKIRQDHLSRLIDELVSGQRDRGDEYPLMILDNLMVVAGTIAIVGEGGDWDLDIDEDAAEHLTVTIADPGPPMWERLSAFEGVAHFLNRRGGWSVTPTAVQHAAYGVRDGDGFDLPQS